MTWKKGTNLKIAQMTSNFDFKFVLCKDGDEFGAENQEKLHKCCLVFIAKLATDIRL